MQREARRSQLAGERKNASLYRPIESKREVIGAATELISDHDGLKRTYAATKERDDLSLTQPKLAVTEKQKIMTALQSELQPTESRVEEAHITSSVIWKQSEEARRQMQNAVTATQASARSLDSVNLSRIVQIERLRPDLDHRSPCTISLIGLVNSLQML